MGHPTTSLVSALLQQLLELLLCVVELVFIRLGVPVAGRGGDLGLLDQGQGLQVDGAALWRRKQVSKGASIYDVRSGRVEGTTKADKRNKIS